VNGDTRWRRRRLVVAAITPIIAMTVASTSHAQPAVAPTTGSTDGIAAAETWCNDEAIDIRESGPAGPYPSTITVDGAETEPTVVTVDLLGVSHTYTSDVDVMLVSPAGQNLVLMSDAGSSDDLEGVDLTFSDFAAGPLRADNAPSTGAYVPTNFDDEDDWLAPAPSDSGATTLATFNGTDPNGTWNLYVVDDVGGDGGRIASWCLNVSSGALTVTTVTSSATTALPGEDVTFTATVTSGGSPVTAGAVTFSDGATTLASVDVDPSGRAVFTTAALAPGSHQITTTFTGDGFVTSRRTVRQFIDSPTTIPAAGRWCNSGSVEGPDAGPAGPYPSRIFVGGAGTYTTEIAVQLRDLVHGSSNDLDVMLVGPTGRSLVLMSDAGDDAEGVDLTFSDGAADALPEDDDLTTGVYRPTNVDDDRDAWLPPAPSDSGLSTLATFNGLDPNGTWRLFVVDDEEELIGEVLGGWCLDITVDERGPQARPTTTPAPNAAGWHHGAVAVNWNWDDAVPGVDQARCTNQTIFRGEGRRALTATCWDRESNQTTATHMVRVDTTAPTVRVTLPSARRYMQRAVVRADYACADRTSGIAACTGTVADGARIDTVIPGRHRFTVTAVDRAGNRYRAGVTYTVVVPPTCAGWQATIVGTSGRDVITGTRGRDVIVTGGGRDTIAGRGGRDTICAGGGNDIVDGGGGGDLLVGDAGTDILLGRSGNDHLEGGGGADRCDGGPGADDAIACEATADIP
jgi:Ca2+-binding RTX toxin-like protein